MALNYFEYEPQYKEQLSNMINKLFIEDPEGEPMSQEKIDLTIEHAKKYPDNLRIYILKNSNDEAIGYATIQLFWSNEWGGLTANIDELYIMQNERGKGIGTDFIKAITTIIPEVNRVTLEVTPSNVNALKLYKKLGFEEFKTISMERV